jgi:osmoprotectant transport system permease protein
MIADSNIAEALARLPEYLGGHVLVSMTALFLGLVVSFPLAIISMRRTTLRRILLAVASVAQTIPGLALLALFYPLLLALAALTERMFGIGFSALGFLPSVLALALYSMLPVLRNTITGLEGIDPAVTEAARGVGMTPRQSLTMVELPLALPVIMAGIRTAAVWVIGTATLSTPIGQTSLGNYIFTGLQTQNWVFVLFGCVVAALLALVVDQLLALMETGVGKRSRRRVAFGAVGLVCLLAASLLPSLGRQGADYIVGSKPFSEQYVLAALMQQRLSDGGLSAGRRDGLGSGVIFDALKANEIDVYVEYTGTIWANQMQRSDVKSRDEVMREVTGWLKERHGITVVGGLGFENAYALAMSSSRAKALGVRSIADLARHAPTLTRRDHAGGAKASERPRDARRASAADQRHRRYPDARSEPPRNSRGRNARPRGALALRRNREARRTKEIARPRPRGALSDGNAVSLFLFPQPDQAGRGEQLAFGLLKELLAGKPRG